MVNRPIVIIRTNVHDIRVVDFALSPRDFPLVVSGAYSVSCKIYGIAVRINFDSISCSMTIDNNYQQLGIIDTIRMSHMMFEYLSPVRSYSSIGSWGTVAEESLLLAGSRDGANWQFGELSL